MNSERAFCGSRGGHEERSRAHAKLQRQVLLSGKEGIGDVKHAVAVVIRHCQLRRRKRFDPQQLAQNPARVDCRAPKRKHHLVSGTVTLTIAFRPPFWHLRIRNREEDEDDSSNQGVSLWVERRARWRSDSRIT